MAEFVMVHGTGCGGWVWKKMAPLLRAKGHGVYTPTLTGLADRKHLLNNGVTLTTHITDIVNLIYYEDLRNVILVGNSYAGMVITGAASKIPDRLRLLVYLDAYLPDNGQSEADLLPEDVFAVRRADAAANGGLLPPPPPKIFGITDPQLVDWIQARMSPHPLETYLEPVQIRNIDSLPIPRLYIHCIGNPPTTPDFFSHSATKAKEQGWPVIELEAGHLAMLSHPDLVTTILQNAVEREI